MKKRQFTATGYLVHEHKVLLIFHQKLKKWLPPGGHVEANELPSEAALREVSEETGFVGEIVSDEKLWVKEWNAVSIPRPFLCLLEQIPPHGEEPAHEHVDFIYRMRLIGGDPLKGSEKMRWFTLEELQLFTPDQEIFAETLQVIDSLFTTDTIGIN